MAWKTALTCSSCNGQKVLSWLLGGFLFQHQLGDHKHVIGGSVSTCEDSAVLDLPKVTPQYLNVINVLFAYPVC